ncbi:VrrA/YqfQ family protein [Salibacterium salarium]|uniref:VrrA/YqfQ family protein n=1 Tax=Salibacterium salarium TaxID=284579 RepID=UPI001639C2D2|nr:VrrA/YqfQ family protein [Salibacterium salarium]
MLSLYPSSHPIPPAAPMPPPAPGVGFHDQSIPFASPDEMARNPIFAAAPYITQPSNLAAILPQIQRMIGIAQTVAPYVRQYYPIVKQLPALWSLLSTSSSSGETSTKDIVADDQFYKNENITESYDSEFPPPKLYV